MNEAGLPARLAGGDRRSIGHVPEVIADVLKNPLLFVALIDGMTAADPVVRMRAADAAEKISARHPEWLQPYKARLLGPIAASDQQEVRWHVAQMLPRLDLSPNERTRAAKVLTGFLSDRSRIVVVFAMTALAELAAGDDRLKVRVIKLVVELSKTGSPAIESRGRKLLKLFE